MSIDASIAQASAEAAAASATTAAQAAERAVVTVTAFNAGLDEVVEETATAAVQEFAEDMTNPDGAIGAKLAATVATVLEAEAASDDGVISTAIRTRSADWVNVRGYGAVGDGIADDTAALAAAEAAAAGRWIYLPMGQYRITSQLTLTTCRGLVGDGMFVSTIYADIPAGATALSYTGGGRVVRDFSLMAGTPSNTEEQRRSIARNGINAHHESGHNAYANVRVFGFNGFGFKITTIWDSVLSNLISEDCGNATEWAFSVNDGNDTSNHCVFQRIQVERPTDKGLYAEGLANHWVDIHIERLNRVNSDNATTSHVLRGDFCTYENARTGQSANQTAIKPRMVVGGTGNAYREFRVPDAEVVILAQVNGGTASTFSGIVGTFVTDSNNIGVFHVKDSLIGFANIYNGTNLTNLYSNCVFSGNMMLHGSGVSVGLTDCNFTASAQVLEGAGNPAVVARGCSFPQVPVVASASLYGCTIRSAAAFTRYAAKYRVYGGTILGDALISNDHVQVDLYGTEVTGALTQGGGNPTGRAHDVTLSAGSPTVSSRWRAGGTLAAGIGGTAATTVGTLTGKMQAFDAKGNALGWVPVYDAIT